MKKILFLFLLMPLLISCKSNEDKINDLIREQMFHTLYDYQSYEPIETQITETLYSPENDQNYIDFIKIYTKAKKEGKIDDRQEKRADETSIGLLNLQDSVYRTIGLYNTTMGYTVTHKFRCKSRGGMYDLVTQKIFVDKNIEKIIWQYEIDENNSIDLNIISFMMKWELHKNEKKFLEEYKNENIKFLENNKKEEGVLCTESGLQYKIIEKGNGKIPNATDYISFHYRVKTIDGNILNDSYSIQNTPFNVRADMLMKGMVEAITMMPLGSKWTLYVPYNLAYGEKGFGEDIKPYSTMIIEDFHLIGIGKNK